MKSGSERDVLLEGDKYEEGEKLALWVMQWSKELIFACNFVKFFNIIGQ